MAIDVHQLHPLEVKVLLSFSPGTPLTHTILQEKLGFNIGQSNQAFSWLLAKGLVEEHERTTRTYYELTPLGEEYAERGTPEARILSLLEEAGPLPLPEIASRLDLEQKEVGTAFGQMKKDGLLAMDEEKRVVIADPSATGRIEGVRNLIRKAKEKGGSLSEEELSDEERTLVQTISRKRGAGSEPFKVVEREQVSYVLTREAADVAQELAKAGFTGEELGAVTPEMLKTGAWKAKRFRPYNIQIPPKRLLIGRTNAYCDYLAWVKDKMVALGFEEFDGPLVETEFWNSDALFMPQFHSARDIHDVYYIEEPQYAKEIPEPYLSRVAATHEHGWETGSRGWEYTFDRTFTRRLILRSQGTVLSAKQLTKAKVPGKYFGIVRCFRHDQVDATHLSDFYQTEGIVLGEEVNLRNLLGLLKMFAEEVAGATEVKYVPGYFPFTEPSVEVHIKHPVLGWFELGGSGIFRPEVTKPLGIEVPVLAWGLGIDRMALMHLGLNDLRDLFTYDIEAARLRRRS